MRDVVDRLASIAPTLGPQMRRAADLVLAQPNQVAVMSMRALASRAGVAPPTMLRLARALDFENYEAFRDVFRSNVTGLRYGARASDLGVLRGRGGVAEIVQRTADAAERNIQMLFSGDVSHRVDAMARLLSESENVHIAAAGSPQGLAQSFQYVAHMAFPHVRIVPMGGASIHDSLVHLSASDTVLALTMEPYARPTVDVVGFARERGARIAVVTDVPSSPVAEGADAAIFVGTDSPHFFPSIVAMTCALEAVLTAMVANGGPDVIDKITDIESILQAKGAYWSAPKHS
jgi:DNA-binding MurR/RpiR family transcriptional regulator